MNDFERSANPPEIAVMDATAFSKSFPLEVSVDRQACGAFLVGCNIEPEEVPGVSLEVTSKVCVRGQMIDEEHGVGQLLFVDHDTLDRNVTLHAGSIMQEIITASQAGRTLPLPEMQKHINREIGAALSCCADELTIGHKGVLKEIEDAKRAMRRAVLSKRFPLGFGGSAFSWGVTEAATGSPIAASLALGLVAGTSYFEGRNFLRTQYRVTDITEGWPYQVRAKRRVTELIEEPERPLVSFGWKFDR